MRMPVGVVMALGPVAVLVHGTVVMVVVVAPVLGPASVPLPLFGWKVARLSGGAKVCAQTWQRHVSMYEKTSRPGKDMCQCTKTPTRPGKGLVEADVIPG